MLRPEFAFDLDDVLSYTTEGVVGYGRTQGHDLEFGDITSSAYWDRHGIPQEDAIGIVHGYERAGYPDLRPVEGAQDAVACLAEVFDLSIITARDQEFDAVTKAWVGAHFGAAFRAIVHVGNPYVSRAFRAKHEVCGERGIVALVDDSHKHAIACARVGIRAYLFGGYDWQKLVEPHSLLEPVSTWPDVTQKLLTHYG